MSASEPLQKVSVAQRNLLQSYLQWKMNALRGNNELLEKFPHSLKTQDPAR
jgi:hypothetical protein